MPLVIDTYNNYFSYLQQRKRVAPATLKANELALGYFSLVYGYMETENLLPIHMVRFQQFLQERKRLQKNEQGEYVRLSKYSVYKIMVRLRSYIRRLESERQLWDLKPIDIPIGNVPCPIPKYLSKEELQKIISYLDEQVRKADEWSKKVERYDAYFYRAIIRFLYTTWLRNSELRTLKIQDINLDQLLGAVIGKGNKYGAITFSETAKQHLTSYLNMRATMFPRKNFEYIFTPYTHNANKFLTEQWLSKMVKKIGVKAGITTKTNPHIFRHTLATHLMQSGYTIVQVRDKLRHSSVSVTNVYTHSNPTEQMTMTKNIDTSILKSI